MFTVIFPQKFEVSAALCFRVNLKHVSRDWQQDGGPQGSRLRCVLQAS